MNPHLSHLIPLLLSVGGFLLLALAMPRHQEDVCGRLLTTRISLLLRGSGWGFLASALTLSIQAHGAGMGLVSWVAQLSMAAGLVFVGLLIHQRRKAGR
ncbi:MAG: DUF3325 domain-containing protein [Lautropia sp.]|nr:DUF3325 domain-containing protein [Lautropia sp.]